ncbi:MAG TPA: 6,7-dimethyl-8-ribityllumazine synthase [Planctomycetota bacterium]|nr:6,7-dimethyl-8-ribityllumazine synthase [Planctomycetota bacterium]
MRRDFRGDFRGNGKRFAVVVSRFNEFITEHLLEGCLDTLRRHGVADRAVQIVRVPGALEIPVALKRVLQRRKPHAAICLGCVIRGETPHFDHVAAETSRGIAEVSREAGIPVAHGVIAADTLEQAIERAGAKMGNKGREAALAALEMANLLDTL